MSVLFSDDEITEELRDTNITYLGIGDPDACVDILNVYVYEVRFKYCHIFHRYHDLKLVCHGIISIYHKDEMHVLSCCLYHTLTQHVIPL